MCASLHCCVIDFFFLVVIVLRVSFRCVCGVHHTPNLGQRSKSVFLALVSVCGSVSRCAFSLSTTLSAKVLESSKDSLFFSVKQYFDFPAHWMTFCVLCVCVRQVFLWQMFSLMFCFAWLSRFLLLDSLNLWVDFACVILISSNGNICYSLFTLIVTFYFCFYDMSIWGVFWVILTWKHFAFSRECWTLINGWKWRRWKLWYASCCFSFYFPCVFVCFLLDNLTITSSGHLARSCLLQCLIFICCFYRDTFAQLYF